MFAVSE